MNDTQNEIKKDIQGTNSDSNQTRTQINDLEQNEEVTPTWNGMNKEFKKMRRGLGTSGTALNVPTSES